MNSRTESLLRVVAAAVAVCLVVSLFYPGTLASPYVDTNDEFEAIYEHQLHEPVEAAELIERHGEDVDRYHYDELSLAAQQLFDRTKEAPDNTYEPTVCREWTLICDEYSVEDFPDEFAYGTAGHDLGTQEALTRIEYEGEEYVLQTGTTGHGDAVFDVDAFVDDILLWATLLPAGFVLGITALGRGHRRSVTSSVIGGSSLLGLALLTPYIHMAGLAPARVIHWTLLVGVWGSILYVSISLLEDEGND